jgi:TM2 domain-containing membrane protein YozV
MTEMCVKCGARVGTKLAGDISLKSRLATTLLAWFLGTVGAHRFYIGKIGTAVVMLLLGIVGWATIWIFGFGLVLLVAVGIWALVDFIFAVTGRMRDSEGKLIQKW